MNINDLLVTVFAQLNEKKENFYIKLAFKHIENMKCISNDK